MAAVNIDGDASRRKDWKRTGRTQITNELMLGSASSSASAVSGITRRQATGEIDGRVVAEHVPQLALDDADILGVAGVHLDHLYDEGFEAVWDLLLHIERREREGGTSGSMPVSSVCSVAPRL